MNMVTDNTAAGSEKTEAILKSAFTAISQYGYRRTSMEDIARGAEMSRAALYLHYRNKEDIFRSLMTHYYDAAVADVAAVLGRGLEAPEALQAAFMAQGGPYMEALLSSPHGDELIDSKLTLGADIAQAGLERLIEVYAGWLRRETVAGRITLAGFSGDAESVVETMMAALYGQKLSKPDYATYQRRVRQLAAVFGRGLRGSGE